MVAVLIGFVLLGRLRRVRPDEGQVPRRALGPVGLPVADRPHADLLPRQLSRARRRQPQHAQLRPLRRAAPPPLRRRLRAWPTRPGSPARRHRPTSTRPSPRPRSRTRSSPPVSLRPGGVLPTVNSSPEGEVAQGDVDPGDEDRRRGDDEAVLREAPEGDRVAVPGGDADDDDVRAGADGGRVPAEVGAEGQRPPGRVGAGCAVARPGPGRATSGAIVATYGMLSTIPDSAPEAPSSTVEASKYRSPTASVTAEASEPITPTSTRAPTMTNRPMKKTRVDHSTSSRHSATSSRESATRAPAPSSATSDGSTSQRSGRRSRPARRPAPRRTSRAAGRRGSPPARPGPSARPPAPAS